MLVQICFVALFTSVAVAVSSDRSYDQKATVIKNNLLACTISTNSLDECINSWSLKYATHNLPKASEMTVNQRNAFFSNVNAVIALNSKVNLTWIADLNAFSHFTLDEFKSNYMAGNLTLPTSESINLKVETPRNITLDAVDWSDVTFNGIQSIASVKDQGNQGVSWAFAAVGAIEAAVAINSGGNDSVILSEQFTITGTNQWYKNSTQCSGGSTWDALLFATTKGIRSKSDYPYSENCGATLDKSFYQEPFVGIQSMREPAAIHDLNGDYNRAVISRLAIQPVTIYTRVGIESIFFYSEGVIEDNQNCTQGIDQAMLLVGYNSTEGYYKARNSWGTGWGESGFIRFAMTNSTYGTCNILQHMYYPSFEYNSGTIGLKSCRVNETSDVAHYSKSSLSAFASTTTQTISSSEIASITHVEPSTISPSSIMQPFITASAIQSTGFLITERSTMTMATPSFIIKETILVEVAASISNFTRPLATSTASVVVSSITPFSMTLTTPFLSATPSSSQTSKELSMNVVASAAIPKLQNKKRELSILVYEELEAQAFSSLLLTPSQTFQLSTTPQDTTTFSSVTEPTLTTGIQSFSSILPTVISFTNNLFRRQVKKSLNYLSAIEQVSVQLKTTHSVEKYVKITKPTRSSDKVVSETPQTTNVTKKEQNKKVGTSRTSQDQKVNATKVDKVKESAHTIEMITATATRTTSIKTPMSSTGVPVFQVFFTKVFEHKESPRN